MMPAHRRLALRLVFRRSQGPSGKKPLESFRVRVDYVAAKPGFVAERPGILLQQMKGFPAVEIRESLYPRWQHHLQVVRTSLTVLICWMRTKTLCWVTVHIPRAIAGTPPGRIEKQL